MTSSPKDAGDLLLQGPEAHQRILTAIGESQAMPSAMTDARPITRRMVDCRREGVEWLWPNRFPLGCVSIIGGMPGEGKSTLTCLLAARVTNGQAWPDGSANGCRGNVVFITSEDDVGSVTRPRFEDMGGDVRRATVLDAIGVGAKEYLFNLSDNGLAVLEQLLAGDSEVRLVVIDPISAVLGKTDSHRDADVRHLLRPLAELARKYRVAVIMVGHLNKAQMGSAMERFGGSIGFVAIARAAYLFVSDKHDKNLRWMLEVKKNLGPRQDGLAFQVGSSERGNACVLTRVERSNPPTADEALVALSCAATTGSKLSKIERAVAWLEDLLSNGPKLQCDIVALGLASNHSQRTLERAKEKLGITSKKISHDGPWAWFNADDYAGSDAPDLLMELAALHKTHFKEDATRFTQDATTANLAALVGRENP